MPKTLRIRERERESHIILLRLRCSLLCFSFWCEPYATLLLKPCKLVPPPYTTVYSSSPWMMPSICVYVCVCVCERERDMHVRVPPCSQPLKLLMLLQYLETLTNLSAICMVVVLAWQYSICITWDHFTSIIFKAFQFLYSPSCVK